MYVLCGIITKSLGKVKENMLNIQQNFYKVRYRSRRVPCPFCQITLKAPKPLKDRYTKSFYRQQLKNIGSELSRKRLQLGISQTKLAKKLDVRVETIQNWEHSRSIPDIRYLPQLMSFLGYDPFEAISTL